MQHDEVQTPWMEHYVGTFTDEYMQDWRHKTIEWDVPVEARMQHECDIVDFVMTIEINSITFHSTQRTGLISSTAAIVTPYSAWPRGCGSLERVLTSELLLLRHRLIPMTSTSCTAF
jgi:hypothetical protein